MTKIKFTDKELIYIRELIKGQIPSFVDKSNIPAIHNTIITKISQYLFNDEEKWEKYNVKDVNVIVEFSGYLDIIFVLIVGWYGKMKEEQKENKDVHKTGR